MSEEIQKDFTVKEIADIMQVSDARVRQLLLSGELVGYKRSARLWLIRYADAIRFFQEHSIKYQKNEDS